MTAIEILRASLSGVEVRECPLYKGQFAVAADGRIFRVSGGEPIELPLTPKRDRPYKFVSLNGDKWLAHVVVCVTFRGKRPPGMEVRHLDGNGAHNAATNLSWATHTVNEHDKFRHGTKRRRVVR